jgi:hypothetical protein
VEVVLENIILLLAGLVVLVVLDIVVVALVDMDTIHQHHHLLRQIFHLHIHME